MLDQLAAHGVGRVEITLHVGYGTFKPVRTEVVEEHTVDPEWYEIPSQAAERLAEVRRGGGRVVAVGTTVARTLETGAATLSEQARASGEVVAAGTSC